MSRPNISNPIPVVPSSSTFPAGSSSTGAGTGAGSTSRQHYGEGTSASSSRTRQSSGHSGHSSSSRSGPNALDSSITRLLVVTKQMLQALEQWSQGQISEEGVSDVYVKLGNGFEQCVDAFRRVGISTRELDSIPGDLRVCLEQTLADDPSKETLDVYLPNIRAIIFNLLNGLKQRQAAYKRVLLDRQADTPPPPPPPQLAPAAFTSSASSSTTATPTAPAPPVFTTTPTSTIGSLPGPGPPPSGPIPPLPPPRDPVAEANAKLTARAGTPTSLQSSSPASSLNNNNNGLPKLPSSMALAERSQRNASATRAAPPPDAFRPPRRVNDSHSGNVANNVLPRRTSSSSQAQSLSTSSPTVGHFGQVPPPSLTAGGDAMNGSSSPSPVRPEDGLIRHQLSDKPVPLPGSLSSLSPVPMILAPAPNVNRPTPPRPDRFSRDSFGNPRPVSRFSVDSEITNGSPIRSPTAQSPPATIGILSEQDAESDEDNSPPLHSASTIMGQASTQALAAVAPASSLPLLNLPSSPIEIPQPSVRTPPPMHEPLRDREMPSATRSTLAALQRSDPLERRASKRFSSYTFNKMVPGSPNNKGNPQRPMRSNDRAPPLPALPALSESSFSASLGGLGVSPDDDRSIASSTRTHLQANGHGAGTSSERSVSPTSNRSPSPQPDTESSMRIISTPVLAARALAASSAQVIDESVPAQDATSLSIFLQIGRRVKKATVELPASFSALRLLFMERFEYDPGLEDFPEVYIRDNRTGVQFELEEMEDLKEGCVLSLDIEPLDQIKQHFDLTVSSLMQELKELKSSFDHSRRASILPAASMLSVSPSMNFAAAAPRPALNPTMSHSPSVTFTPAKPLVLDAKKEADLRAQYDEVQSLRRDLAVMKQLHVDFLSETKESFTRLRTQNSAMRDVVKTKMGGSRGLLDNSKARIEAQCQEAIQLVEEVSDVIDASREDAHRRHVTPSRSQMATIRADLEKATIAVDHFARDVTLADPTWRATWASELNRVMEEQKLLSYQSKLSVDLKNDIKDAKEMLQTVQDFVDHRAAGMARVGPKGLGGGYRPASPSDKTGGNGSGGHGNGNGNGEGGMPHLLMEIRTKEADPNSRLRAIEAQQRAREKELANKEDEFSSELGNFVKGRKLKKTGGTEEAERVRARRTEVTLKRMLTGDNGTGPDSGGILTPQMTGMSTTSGMTPQYTGMSAITPQMTGMSIMSNMSGMSGSNGMGMVGSGSGPLSPQTTGMTERNRNSAGSGPA